MLGDGFLLLHHHTQSSFLYRGNSRSNTAGDVVDSSTDRRDGTDLTASLSLQIRTRLTLFHSLASSCKALSTFQRLRPDFFLFPVRVSCSCLKGSRQSQDFLIVSPRKTFLNPC